jgi:acyl dehydratase
MFRRRAAGAVTSSRSGQTTSIPRVLQKEENMAVNATTPKAVANGIEDVVALKDQVVGPSQWREVTQEMVNQFADLSGDHQWIHLDVERAKAESPFGTTIAHGNLTLSLIDGLRGELNEWNGFTLAVNYGWNKVRFPAPVVVGASLRCVQQIVEVTEIGGGWHQIVTRFTVEAEGTKKPVCVADSVVRVFAEPA